MMIGELPRGWSYIRIADLAELNPRLQLENVHDDLIVTFLPMKNVTEVKNKISLLETRKFSEVKRGFTPMTDGDVIFAKITPCMENGKIAIVDNLKNGIAFGSTEFHVFRCSSVLKNHYLFYFLVQEQFRREAEQNMTGAVGQRRVPKKFLADHLIPLPPLPEQHRIVAKIEELFASLDKGIEALKTAQQQLKVYRQAVLKYAFEGKLTHPDLKEGELPEGWYQTDVRSIASSIQYGYTESSSKERVGPKFLRITDIQENKVNWEQVPYCKIAKADATKYLLKDGDLVFARTGATVGKSFLLKGDIPESVFASYLIRVRFPESILDKFIWYYFQSPAYWAQILDKSVGTGQPNVNGTSLGELIVVIPRKLNEQRRIVEEIESRLSISDKIEEALKRGVDQAEALRQSILKKAFEGKLVPQDPNDEPASVLLERIRAGRVASAPFNKPVAKKGRRVKA